MNHSSNLVQTAEQWLEAPVDTDFKAAIATSEALLDELQQAMREPGADRRRLGALIGRVKGTAKRLAAVEPIDWVAVGAGHLAIGHRPGADLVGSLKLQGATHILTLLSEKEGGRKVEGFCREQDLAWLWLPMASARPPAEDRYAEIACQFNDLATILNDGGRIYLHCSAGIHRTGMITVALLRFLGLDGPAAMETLRALRPTTHAGAGDHRLAWAHSVWQDLQGACAVVTPLA
ncbi:protein-tyrosine phosphatase family protein [Neolewinella litorea]|nr:tyrosine-protein phosphatase [Neolewinella litorea]